MELVLPNNYVVLEQEEMMYLDGVVLVVTGGTNVIILLQLQFLEGCQYTRHMPLKS
ncbi:Membrane protein [Streptococcus pneumoniae]|nr:Membrane protein [Streptococcus pneumoniae]